MRTEPEKNTAQGDHATPLHVHTLETLCKELISGRAVLVDDKGNKFRLVSAETRSLLNWHWNNRRKWAQLNKKIDVEAMVDKLDEAPPVFQITEIADESQESRRVYLKSMYVHRFAGIHRYGSPENAPADFEFKFDKGLTLIEGQNGAGKTSLLNVICWCLTGYIYRAQRPPEVIDEGVLIRMKEDRGIEPENGNTYDIAAITPAPSAEVLEALGDGNPVPLDTSVELFFVDSEGKELGSRKRAVQRGRQGNIKVTEPDFSFLKLDPIAREVGTKMPGLIPYIQLGNVSELGQAVAGLTGLKPLEDLCNYAKKSQDKLKDDLVKDRNRDITSLDDDFSKRRDELKGLVQNHPEIKPKESLPKSGPDRTIEKTLDAIKEHFASLEAQMLVKARDILGESFDHEDDNARKDLRENVGPAIGLLDARELSQLDSAKRLIQLKNLDEKELSEVEKLIGKVRAEANELVELAEKPSIAARLRLYARVANWIKGLTDEYRPAEYEHVENCPICQTQLEGKVDPVTSKHVKEHIQQYLVGESEHIQKTLHDWEKGTVQKLAHELPNALSDEMGKELPEKPIDFISTALVDERFKSKPLKGTLSPLKEAARLLCDTALGSLPTFKEPAIDELPEYFEDKEGGIRQAIRQVTRAIAFARWRKENEDLCKEAFKKIVGEYAEQPDIASYREGEIAELPLLGRLKILQEIISNSEHVISALSKVGEMKGKLGARRKIEDRLALYGRASVAIDELLGMRQLVERQVGFLIKTLSAATQNWKKVLYRPAFADAPTVVKTDVGTDGSLAFEAETQGVITAAQHIVNTSDLRATLLAFLLAFWEYLLNKRGGLSLLLLDDLQELFDPRNRRLIANNVAKIAESGRQVIVTTNDPVFGTRAANSAYERLGYDSVDHRCIHALRASREHIELGYFAEEIEKKRKVFEEEENEHGPARDYVNKLRNYIENRLIDLFDVSDSGLPKKPTLSHLMNAIRARISAGNEPFTGKVFQKLVDDSALKEGSEFLDLMNQSHHGEADQIMYNDVLQVKDDCIHVRKLVKAVYEEYERWLRRDLRQLVPAMPNIPVALTLPTFSVPVIENLAAFTAEVAPGEPIEMGERFDSSVLANHAIYVVNTHNLGFAAKANSRVIVDLADENVPDQSLVIALHKERVYARRLLRDTENPRVISLGSEAENPLNRPPSVILPAEETRLLKIVGILFDERPHYPVPREEAVLVNERGYLERVKIVFRVLHGESALPLALPGQTILGGRSLVTSQLAKMEGRPVAISTSEGSVLKRIGGALPGAPHIRLFESIGGLGESVLVRTEDIRDSFGQLPVLQSTREVIGVLYDLD